MSTFCIGFGGVCIIVQLSSHWQMSTLHSPSPVMGSEEETRSTESSLRSPFKSTIDLPQHQTMHSENHYTIHEDSRSNSPTIPADASSTPNRTLSPNKYFSPSRFDKHSSPRKPLGELTMSEVEGRSPKPGTAGLQDGNNDRESNEDIDDAFVAPVKDFNPDDTCFSTFSAVPNTDMTAFARLDGSPTKSSTFEEFRTPRTSRPVTPGTVRAREYQQASPTPRGNRSRDDQTTQLLEFSEVLNLQQGHRSPHRNQYSPSKLRSQPELGSRKPGSPTKDGFRPTLPAEARQFANLLDFDLPPAPTPRSIPTITARELEGLKAGFLSEISSLKANLSGKEAEIQSLKEAKDDAENRVGKASEELRDVHGANEGLLAEKADWEKRDKEMQSILRDVKSELVHGEREREELATRAEGLEKRLEESETRASEAESKVAGLRTDKTEGEDPATPGSNKAVEVAVEKVARELHTLYKTKHETKVTALKRSYEARWEKRVSELERRIEDLSRENEDLKVGRDATMTKVALPGNEADALKAEREAEAQLFAEEKAATTKQLDEMGASLDALRFDVGNLRKENGRLISDLETSRQENSELVAAVEQMLQLESVQVEKSVPTEAKANTTRVSGLRGPGFGNSESRIGTFKRSVSGTGRSGIMSNIERMGRGKMVD